MIRYKPKKIYLEKEIAENAYALKILSKFPEVAVDIIDDVAKFIKEENKKGSIYDKREQPLLLAKQRGSFFEKCPGTKEHLCCNYYTLNIAVGCPFDCTYCFLQSYTNNPFYTVYVNLEDMLAELKSKLVPGKKIRIGTGEFTDSLALEDISGFAREYVPRILALDPQIVVELKTKSDNIDWLAGFGYQDQLVLAWSVNPPEIIAKDERYAVRLEQRIDAAAKAIELGYKIALHFDPIIYAAGWQEKYFKVIDLLQEKLDPQKIAWLSLGLLRFTPSLKPIVEQKFPDSKIIYGEFFPGADKKMRYPEPLRIAVFKKMAERLHDWSDELPVYFCMESSSVWQAVLGGLPASANKLNHLFS